jgi:tetrahydromethanopterin S-methyltransferase subunit B
MSNESNELIHYRLTEVEEKVKKIDGKLNDTVINLEVMKTELSQATGKQSTVISSIVSVIVGVLIFVFTGGLK